MIRNDLKEKIVELLPLLVKAGFKVHYEYKTTRFFFWRPAKEKIIIEADRNV